jgi:hypothetical protein
MAFLAYLSPFSSYFLIFGSAAKEAPPNGENFSIKNPSTTYCWWSVDILPPSATIFKLFVNFHPLLHLGFI